MSTPSRLPAVLAYIPVIGWLYVYFLQRQNILAVYHLRQGIGLVLFLIGIFVAWAVIAWLLAWIPYLAILSVALFTIVIAAYMYGVVALIMGMRNASSSKLAPLPLFGRWANRLPIK
jgi:uncharacterized membrane protein